MCTKCTSDGDPLQERFCRLVLERIHNTEVTIEELRIAAEIGSADFVKDVISPAWNARSQIEVGRATDFTTTHKACRRAPTDQPSYELGIKKLVDLAADHDEIMEALRMAPPDSTIERKAFDIAFLHFCIPYEQFKDLYYSARFDDPDREYHCLLTMIMKAEITVEIAEAHDAIRGAIKDTKNRGIEAPQKLLDLMDKANTKLAAALQAAGA